MSCSRLVPRPGALLTAGLIGLFLAVGCTRRTPPTPPSSAGTPAAPGDHFTVRSQGFRGTIQRSDPEYKAICRLFEIGQESRNYSKADLGDRKVAPVHRLKAHPAGKQGANQVIASLEHYSPERMIRTDQYGLRRLPRDVEKEMVDLWRSIRASATTPPINPAGPPSDNP